jgi:hypothetical protein
MNAQLALFAAFGCASIAAAQPLYVNGGEQTPGSAGIARSTATRSGVVAPPGVRFAEVAGSSVESNLFAGFCLSPDPSGLPGGSHRVADDLVVTGEFGWRLRSITLYVYVTGASFGPSPFASGSVRVWDSRPDARDKHVVFGDESNRLVSAVPTDTYRVFHSLPVSGAASPPDLSRRLWAVTLDLGNYIYTRGVYWLEFQLRCVNPDAQAWVVPVTLANGRGPTEADAMVLAPDGLSSSWVPMSDPGRPMLTLDVPQELAFTIDGEVSRPCPADFNVDGGVDGDDVTLFFDAWQSGEESADVNGDGGIDGADITVFFAAWEAGGC